MTITDAEVEAAARQMVRNKFIPRHAEDAVEARVEAEWRGWASDMRAALLAASQARALSSGEGEYVPHLIRYDDQAAADPYWEFIEADIASVTGPVRAANVEMLYDMTDRSKVVGMRVYDAQPGVGWPDWCPPRGTHFIIDHDGFAGKVIGWYDRDDGAQGTVLQLDNAKVVHVYGIKWLKPSPSKENTNE